jgi:hypothetical protein
MTTNRISPRPRVRFSRAAVQLALGASLTLLLSGSACAQYGGGGGGGTPGTPGYVPPKGGYSSGAAIGAGVGAAAGAGLLFYLVTHNRSEVTGCVRSTDDGLVVVDEKKNRSYSLAPGSLDLRPGQRVQIRGKKTNDSGIANFQAKKLVKDLGSCNPGSPAAAASAPARAQ